MKDKLYCKGCSCEITAFIQTISNYEQYCSFICYEGMLKAKSITKCILINLQEGNI